MKLFYDAVARLFRLFPAEVAHEMTIAALQTGLGPVDRHTQEVSLRTTVAGMFLPNCVGLAAGFDKNAQAPDAMLRVGFGLSPATTGASATGASAASSATGSAFTALLRERLRAGLTASATGAPVISVAVMGWSLASVVMVSDAGPQPRLESDQPITALITRR